MPFYITKNNIGKTTNISIRKGILNSYISDSIHKRLYNKNPATDINLYTTKSPSFNTNIPDIYIRNPSCWINGVKNISCISPAQMSGGLAPNLRRGTLITPKHMIFAEHYYIGIPQQGVPFIFVDENNNVVRRKIMQIMPITAQLASPEPNPDLAIGVLDQEVPANIKPAKVLPINFNLYLDVFGNFFGPNTYSLGNMLSLALDQEDKAQIKTLTYYANQPEFSFGLLYIAEKDISVNPYANNWEEYIVAGDSGNPVFLIIDNELVMVTLWSAPFSGPFLPLNYNSINSVINILSPNQGYSLIPIDLESIYQRISSIRICKK